MAVQGRAAGGAAGAIRRAKKRRAAVGKNIQAEREGVARYRPFSCNRTQGMHSAGGSHRKGIPCMPARRRRGAARARGNEMRMGGW